MNRRSFLRFLGCLPLLPSILPQVAAVKADDAAFRTLFATLEEQILVNYKFGLIESFDRELFADDPLQRIRLP